MHSSHRLERDRRLQAEALAERLKQADSKRLLAKQQRKQQTTVPAPAATKHRAPPSVPAPSRGTATIAPDKVGYQHAPPPEDRTSRSQRPASPGRVPPVQMKPRVRYIHTTINYNCNYRADLMLRVGAGVKMC